jgi:hypothetical protein
MLRAEVPLVDVVLALALGPLVGQDLPPRRVQTSRLLACPRTTRARSRLSLTLTLFCSLTLVELS